MVEGMGLASGRVLALALGIGLATAAPACRAQSPADPPLGAESTLRDIERRLDDTAHKLQELKNQVAEEQRRLDAALEQHRRWTDTQLNRLSGRGTAPLPANNARDTEARSVSADSGIQPTAQAAQGGASGQEPGAGRPVGEAPQQPDRPEVTARIFDEPTALTPRGKLVLEPTYQFVHSTDNRVALVGYSVIPAITIGLIDVRRVSRDISSFAVTARYGLTNRFEIEAKVPWISASSSTLTRPLATPSVTDQFFDSRGRGLGDIELAGRYQFNQFRGDNAVYIGYLRYKSRTGKGVFEVPIDPGTGLQNELPTGSGFQAVQGGFTVLYPSDPAVFFGGAAYMHSFSRDVGNGFGTVRPGGVLDLNFGMGLALNEKASFSIGYQHSIVNTTDQRDPEQVARVLAPSGRLQLGTLRFGVAYRLTPKWNMNLSLGVGVTGDSPDLELTMRFPYSL